MLFKPNTRSILTLLPLSQAAAQIKPNFYFYPQGARPCLDQAGYTSRCEGSDTPSLNACLCGNVGNFITNTAICMGQNDGDELLQDVYELMASACTRTQTPIKLSPKEFVDTAKGGNIAPAPPPPPPPPVTSIPIPIPIHTTSRAPPIIIPLIPSSTTTTLETTTSVRLKTTIKATPTTSAIQPLTSENKPDKGMDSGEDKDQKTGKLSKGGAIGISILLTLTGLIIIGVCIWFFRRHRQRTKQEGFGPISSPKSVEIASPLPPIPQPSYPPSFKHYDKLEYGHGMKSQVKTWNTEAKASRERSLPPAPRQPPISMSHPEVAELPAEVVFMHQAEPPAIFEMDSNETVRRYRS